MGRDVRLLEPGARVGVIAPGFAVERSKLESGVETLRRMGYEVIVGDRVLRRQGYLAGSDAQRVADLTELLDGHAVDAIWLARGGYGSARLLDGLPWRRWSRRPVPWIGYSDGTALLLAGLQRGACRPVYGPVVTELGDSSAYHRGSLEMALTGKPQTIQLGKRGVLCAGKARGRLVGGNLTVMTHLLGTRHRPRLDGCVLFLEEIGEPCYRIDRMLTHWRQAGVLDGVQAVLLGSMQVPPRTHFPADRRLADLLRETFEPLRIPVCRGLPFGHLRKKKTLPLGAVITLDTGRGQVVFPSR